MAKRKREVVDGLASGGAVKSRKEQVTLTPKQTPQEEPFISKSKDKDVRLGAAKAVGMEETSARVLESDSSNVLTIQIITGSYERVLHGFTASIPKNLIPEEQHAQSGPKENGKSNYAATQEGIRTVSSKQHSDVSFSDTFLFNAHASAIRCIAVSPPSDSADQKVILATGGTDDSVNLYHLSTAPPAHGSKSKLKVPSLSSTSVTENPKNRELGSLLHHSSSITTLYFPSRSKLLSAAEDNTIAISRTRDWTVLSTIKAPIPKPVGRPSGDTAAPGEVPAGVNDFAVHPSMKLMVSVGKGERCMRLWNLVTGKKAGVLNFSRDMLEQVGEGKFGLGEGRKVEWDEKGEEFVVGFERGAVVFGMDSKPRARISPSPLAKLHQLRYLPNSIRPHTVAMSTEDGRILFYDTQNLAILSATSNGSSETTAKALQIPPCTLVAQVGGPAAAISNRVKDFDILIPSSSDVAPASFIIIAGSSNGAVRVWTVLNSDLPEQGERKPKASESDVVNGSNAAQLQAQTRGDFTAKQVGRLNGTYETNTRITCLKAFIMTGSPDTTEDVEQAEEESSSDSSDDEDDQ